MVFFEAEDDEDTTKNAEEEDLADGFRSVTEEDQIPFEEDGQVELDLHLEEERVDSEVEKAKAVICNFGVHRGRPMKELLETPKESTEMACGILCGSQPEDESGGQGFSGIRHLYEGRSITAISGPQKRGLAFWKGRNQHGIRNTIYHRGCGGSFVYPAASRR